MRVGRREGGEAFRRMKEETSESVRFTPHINQDMKRVRVGRSPEGRSKGRQGEHHAPRQVAIRLWPRLMPVRSPPPYLVGATPAPTSRVRPSLAIPPSCTHL